MLNVALTSLLATQSPQSRLTSNPFELRDPKSGSVLVRGIENQRLEADSLIKETQYYDRNGGVVQTEACRFNGEGHFQASSFKDLLTGEQVEVKTLTGGDRIEMRYKPSDSDTWRQTVLGDNPRLIHAKILPELILERWKEMRSGGQFEVDLLVPVRLTSYLFRVLYDQTGSASAGHPVVVVEASSWLIRQFAPKLRFHFSNESPPTVIGFEGPSPVAIEGELYRRVTSIVRP